ncbi:MAG: ABC transporter permease subunit [Geminicoccaceae bacterium]
MLDFLGHVWAPVLVIATGGAAQIIRILRANLLDEAEPALCRHPPAPRALAEWRLILRYPVRVAMGPLVSTVGWLLPTIISSSIVARIVLNLPTLSPILLRSLLAQDMHLAGGLILLIGVLTLLGTLLSDILLAWLNHGSSADLDAHPFRRCSAARPTPPDRHRVAKWALVWGRFRHHRLALVSGVILALLYLSAIFASSWRRATRKPATPATPSRRRNQSICSTATRTGAWSSAPTSTAMR